MSELGVIWAGSPQGEVGGEAGLIIYERHFIPVTTLAGGYN